MCEPTLRSYFYGSNLCRALEAYGEKMAGPAWSVAHKMDLYAASHRAFASSVSEEDAFKAFGVIYDSLAGRDWGAFRPLGASRCWPAKRIYETLRCAFKPFSVGSGSTLASFSFDRRSVLVLALGAMVGMKPIGDYPTMAVTKFTHFFNPGLFPIWDNAVIDQRVFRRFGTEYADWCSSHRLNADATGAEFLGNYICWASELVTEAGTGFMQVFADWLRDEIPPRRFRAMDATRIPTLYATAFEFTMIGAALAEGY